MTIKKEELEIKQVHDNDKYVVTRKIIEELNGEELKKIYEEIKKANEDAKKQVNEVPKQAEERVKYFKEQIEVLDKREEQFAKFVDKINLKEENKKGNNDGNIKYSS